jgi:septum site-determining protein MinC
MNATPAVRPAFLMKGSAFTFTVLEITGTDTAAFSQELAARTAQSASLLRNAPVVLALEKLEEADGALDLATLVAICRVHTLHPVAVRAQRPDDLAQAAKLGLALLPLRPRERQAEAPAPAAADGASAAGPGAAESTAAGSNPQAAAPAAPRRTRVIAQPVRGGQQIYAEGDLVLLAPVSAGAEVMADGHIHAWAPLRGRVLAGVQGDTEARIYCRELQAELVAVAGHYRTADVLRSHALWGAGAQVLLRDGEIEIVAL